MCYLTVSSGLGQVVVCPQRPDGLDHSHYELHVPVNLLTVPAELQQIPEKCMAYRENKRASLKYELQFYSVSFSFQHPSLLIFSPPRCQGRMWQWCWGDHFVVVAVVTSGRVPRWRMASRETEGADRLPNMCKVSVCTPEPVSGWCCLPLLYWTLVSHFPVGQEEWERRDEEQRVESVLILNTSLLQNH